MSKLETARGGNTIVVLVLLLINPALFSPKFESTVPRISKSIMVDREPKAARMRSRLMFTSRP